MMLLPVPRPVFPRERPQSVVREAASQGCPLSTIKFSLSFSTSFPFLIEGTRTFRLLQFSFFPSPVFEDQLPIREFLARRLTVVSFFDPPP